MGLFNRRKQDEPQPEAADTKPDELEENGEPLDESATQYRTMYLSVLPAGDDVLLQDPESAAPIVMPAFELDLLAQCNHFAHVEEHADAVARRTGLPVDGVTHRLYELVDRGLLVSKQDVVERARSAAATQEPSTPVLDRIAVITSSRPTSLSTCLRSYRERYGADIELVVFDDSSDPAMQTENRRVAADAGAGGRLLYVGEAEKRRLVTELSARSGVELSVVSAAVAEFDGCTLHCGSNRNSVLLDAAGGAVLMVDDDTTARAIRLTDGGDGLRLSSRYDPWSLRLFASQQEALEAADWQDEDLLAWHRRFLGSSPAVCALRSDASAGAREGDRLALDLNEADTGLITAFSHGRGRVAVTSIGVAGDSGMGATMYFLALEGAARERMLENYEAHRGTRAVHRGADVATISNTRFFMSPHAAFDVRDTIPPFPPVLRNADGVFGSVLRSCSPESYIAFLPWSVEHNPPEARSYDFDQVLHSVASVRGNDIIRVIAHAYELSPGVTDPVTRLRAFGHYMTALGTMSPGEFDAFVRNQIIAAVGHRIDRLTHVVAQEGGQPASWAEDCTAVAAEGLRALTDDQLVLSDVPGATPDEKHRRFQRALYRYGQLIDAWPTLLQAAKGLRVAEPLVSH